ncbi:uncharacterized protein LOC123520196 isoform X1 [Portunus trituberculatus]|uniref:uncharacterized protein LOC123520196 isoform X1 n=1 Tax=Portunus trituberculatus TaxID=210409 RepID=UPI001E1D13AF|nr:uncharacterized protein LOC123520196 isoform X1 [Portunus trituberculatus]XP_045138197.1 uncharacterized protein LOC123520196 isoform X1 [Portunus trituberculatus]
MAHGPSSWLERFPAENCSVVYYYPATSQYRSLCSGPPDTAIATTTATSTTTNITTTPITNATTTATNTTPLTYSLTQDKKIIFASVGGVVVVVVAAAGVAALCRKKISVTLRNVALSQTQSQAPVTSPPHQHQHTTGQGRTTNNHAEPLYCDILPDVTDTAAPGRPTDQVIERFYYYEILPDLSARRVAVVGPRAGEDTQGPPTHTAPPLPPRYENLPPHSDAASLHGHMQAAAVRGAPLYATMPSRGTRSALYTKTNSNVL